MLNPTALSLMGFEVAILLITALCVYFHLIPNDLLILALGVVIRGVLGIVPTTSALVTNTAAVRENTVITAAATEGRSKGDVSPDASISSQERSRG